MTTAELAVHWLGAIDYAGAYELQKRLAEARMRGEAPDSLLLLEHPPVITFGRGGKREHVLGDRPALAKKGIQVVETDRGGDVTYHGPGQLVAYPIIDLSPAQRDVRKYVWRLEEVMIRVAENYGLKTHRIAGVNGAWIEGRKIGAVGVRIRRWVTMHGFALNVSVDLSGFDLIIPCGIRDRQVTSLERELGHTVAMPEVIEAAARRFAEVFSKKPVWRKEAILL